MAVFPSTGVADSRGSFDRMDAILDTYGPTMTAKLLEIMRPYLDKGEPDPALARTFEVINKIIYAKHTEVVTAEQGRIAEGLQREEAAELVEETTVALRGRMKFVRTTMEQTFGEAGLAAVPYNGRAARNLDSLIDQAQYMVKSLRAFQAPTGKKAKMTDSMLNVGPPPAILADSLEGKVNELVEARARLLRGRKGSKALQVEKRDALEDFQHDAVNFRGLLKYLLRIADLDDLVGQLYEPQRRSTSNDPPTTETAVAENPPTAEHAA